MSAAEPWRLLDTGPGAGDWNMALDRALLESAAARLGRGEAFAPVLRFYSWQALTLSLGRMQRPAPALLEGCRRVRVPVVRRPTGGKAILHHREVTFSVIAPIAGRGSVIESYRIFARAIAAGLRLLGVEADLCQAGATPPGAALLCFADPAGCDLQVAGRKLVGSAQARLRGALLQQNSLPLVLSHALKPRLFGPAAAQEERWATDLASAMGRAPSLAEVREALAAGFARELGARFQEWPLGAEESSAAQRLRPAFTLSSQAPGG